MVMVAVTATAGNRQGGRRKLSLHRKVFISLFLVRTTRQEAQGEMHSVLGACRADLL